MNPYFQFKVGPYENDFYLYFPVTPYPLRYKNEIFNKLEEYSGYDIIRFLDFHFSAYSYKADFLDFFFYEVTERVKQFPRKAGLRTAMRWVEAKKAGYLRDVHQQAGKASSDESSPADRNDSADVMENLNRSLMDFQARLEQGISEILLEAETSMRGLTSSFSTGSIELNNRLHEDRLIQLLILVQQIKAPGRAEQLFKKMTTTDLAAILHLHFQAFQENKLNTVQRKIAEQAGQLRHSQAKVKRMVEALEDFF